MLAKVLTHSRKILTAYIFDRKKTNDVINQIIDNKGKEYIVINNPRWRGPTSSAQELFENIIMIEEMFNEKEIEIIAKEISDSNVKQIIVNGFTLGYDVLVEKIKKTNRSIKIKVFWHGGYPNFINGEELYFFENVIKLAKAKIIDVIGFAKEGMAETFANMGFNTFFVMNTVNDIEKSRFENKQEDNNTIKIGVYSAGDRAEKNTYNQISATKFIKNSVVDCIPITLKLKDFCKVMKIDYTGETNGLPRQKLLERMAQNDVNLYATFVECAPMLPLESFELGVPCITGNNHHYFKDTELAKYVIVESEDNIDEIAEKIELCLNNRDKIVNLYKEWKIEYDEKVKEKLKEFLDS